MKAVEKKDIVNLPGRRIKDYDAFNFRCHAGLDCFNKCCRNLNLFLYPYDVIRLKDNLDLSSNEFLDRHVDMIMREGSFYPDVLLSMSDNEERTCSFLTESGCSVYPDRPDSCRTFPVEQGLMYDSKKGKPRMIHFFRPPDFCLGQHEEQELTIAEWAEDQDAAAYNKMTVKWAEVKGLFHKDPWGKEGPEGQKGKMAFMAAYNVDMFRGFVFQSSFLERYKVKKALLDKIAKDDTDLMKFGFAWINFFVWGIKSKLVRLR